MSEPNQVLEIFVIGSRIGESIVIRTPGGQFGVVDSYASDPEDSSTNPTIDRLRKLDANRLRFVALTHPHMDHFRGLLSLFREYQGSIDEFWRPPFGQADWSSLFTKFTEEFETEPTDGRRERIAERIKLFRAIIDSVAAEKRRGMRSVTTLDMKVMIEEKEDDFSITCLGPSTDITENYYRELAKNVIVKGSHTETVPHNLASSVLAVKYGNWTGLLGGDTEQKSWNDILDRCGREWVSGARFVKVSHHGSETGSYDKLWRSIESKACDAVVTCFAAQNLPSNEGLRPIRERGFSIYSTNRALALQSSSSPGRPTRMILLPGLRAHNAYGEVRVVVDRIGKSTIDFFEAAGPLDEEI